eukprot:6638481-Alexandrium_andersonii.AAC.1
MSASLVGSEMCIRDSPPSGDLRVYSASRALRSVARCRTWRTSCFPELPACLLYTSDAADDM